MRLAMKPIHFSSRILLLLVTMPPINLCFERRQDEAALVEQ